MNLLGERRGERTPPKAKQTGLAFAVENTGVLGWARTKVLIWLFIWLRAWTKAYDRAMPRLAFSSRRGDHPRAVYTYVVRAPEGEVRVDRRGRLGQTLGESRERRPAAGHLGRCLGASLDGRAGNAGQEGRGGDEDAEELHGCGLVVGLLGCWAVCLAGWLAVGSLTVDAIEMQKAEGDDNSIWESRRGILILRPGRENARTRRGLEESALRALDETGRQPPLS